MKKFILNYGAYAFAALMVCLLLSGFHDFEVIVFCFFITLWLFVEKYEFVLSQSLRDQEKNEHDNVVQLDSYRNR